MAEFKLSDLVKNYSEQLKEEKPDFSQAFEGNIGELTVKDLRNYYAKKVAAGEQITEKDISLLAKSGWSTAREVMDLLPEDAVARFEKMYKQANKDVSSEARMFGHSKENLRGKR